MSILDKFVAALIPPESEEAHRTTHARARMAAGDSDWLEQILDHHEQIEAAFETLQSAETVISRRVAEQHLAVLLTAHTNAEEAVIYPALVLFGHRAQGRSSYAEHAQAKTDLAQLEYLDPMSKAYERTLEHLRRSVAHHMYEEEYGRLLDLKRLTPGAQARLAQRYAEEFQRFCGAESAEGPEASSISPLSPH